MNRWCCFKWCAACHHLAVVNPVTKVCQCGGELSPTGMPVYRRESEVQS